MGSLLLASRGVCPENHEAARKEFRCSLVCVVLLTCVRSVASDNVYSLEEDVEDDEWCDVADEEK